MLAKSQAKTSHHLVTQSAKDHTWKITSTVDPLKADMRLIRRRIGVPCLCRFSSYTMVAGYAEDLGFLAFIANCQKGNAGCKATSVRFLRNRPLSLAQDFKELSDPISGTHKISATRVALIC
jgi:hypothetical protein